MYKFWNERLYHATWKVPRGILNSVNSGTPTNKVIVQFKYEINGVGHILKPLLESKSWIPIST